MSNIRGESLLIEGLKVKNEAAGAVVFSSTPRVAE